MSLFVISRKQCGHCGQSSALNKLTYTRPFQHNNTTYYKPHTAYGNVGSSSRPNLWRKIYRKT